MMREASDMMNSMLCSTIRNKVRVSRWMVRMKSCSVLSRVGLTPEAGSSSSSTRGRTIRLETISSRRRWP
jgi:hypothetical protein